MFIGSFQQNKSRNAHANWQDLRVFD